MRVEPRQRRRATARGVLLTDFRPRPVAKAYGARASYGETAYERGRRLKREATT